MADKQSWKTAFPTVVIAPLMQWWVCSVHGQCPSWTKNALSASSEGSIANLQCFLDWQANKERVPWGQKVWKLLIHALKRALQWTLVCHLSLWKLLRPWCKNKAPNMKFLSSVCLLEARYYKKRAVISIVIYSSSVQSVSFVQFSEIRPQLKYRLKFSISF